MRILFFALFMIAGFVASAQLAYLPDYRTRRDNFNKIQEKDVRSDLAAFTLAGIDESIGKSALASIPVESYDDDSISFSGSHIKVSITAGVFDKSKHKLGYSDNFLVKIDNKPYYGNYGKLPVKTIEKITVVIDKDTVVIPSTAYADLYSPWFTYTDASGKLKTHNDVYLSADGHKIYIYMLNKEALGNYEVTWVIQDKKYLRRVVDSGLLK